MPRSTQNLKKLIFDTLVADSTLQTLLGGSGKIKHSTPLQLAEYPCVVYGIIGETDTPYDEDRSAAIARTRLSIQVFSTSDSSSQSDQIEDRVYAILHGKQLSSATVIAYSLYRVSRNPVYEPEFKVWRIEARYDLVSVGK